MSMSTTLQAATWAATGCAIGFLSQVTTAHADASVADYVAVLKPMNSSVTNRQSAGEAGFATENDELKITVTVVDVSPGIAHLQHFHGFKDDRAASCANQADDANGDGIVDVIETEAVSGTTMVPFTADPASMEIVTDTYPTASDDGTYRYDKTVSLPDLRKAFAEAFGGQDLDFDRRVVYIHSVLPSSVLPDSVASLGDIPAYVTLPIACGEIEPRGN